MSLCQHILMGHDTGQLKVTVGEIARRVREGDQASDDVGRKGGAPNDRRMVASEPSATHSDSRRVHRTDGRQSIRDNFGKASGTRGDVASKGFKVVNLGTDPRVDADAIAIAVTKTSLKDTEETATTGNGKNHASEFTKNLVPVTNTDTALPAEIIKDLQKASDPVGRKADSLTNGVNKPTQENFNGAPGAVALEKFLNRGGLTVVGAIRRGWRANDFVDCMKEDPTDHALAAVASLYEIAKVVNINVHVRKGVLQRCTRNGLRRFGGRRNDKAIPESRRHRNGRCASTNGSASRTRGAANANGSIGSQGNGFQAMGRGILAGHASIGNVSNGLGYQAEHGWRFYPPHREGQWDGHQGRLAVSWWEKDHQGKSIKRGQLNTVEPIGNVNFVHAHRAKTGIGMANAKQKPFKGAPKLHSFGGPKSSSSIVDTPKGQVNNEAGSPVTLRNDPKGRKHEAREVLDQVEGKDRPEAFGTKISHLVLNKFSMIKSGFVRSASKLGAEVGIGPGGAPNFARCPLPAELVKVHAGAMTKTLDPTRQVQSARVLMDATQPGRCEHERDNR